MSTKIITQKIRNPFYDSENSNSKKWIDLIEIKEPGTTPIFKGELEEYNLEGLITEDIIPQEVINTNAIKNGAITAEKLNIKASVRINQPSISIDTGTNSLIISSSVVNDKNVTISNNSGG